MMVPSVCVCVCVCMCTVCVYIMYTFPGLCEFLYDQVHGIINKEIAKYDDYLMKRHLTRVDGKPRDIAQVRR